MQYARTQVMQRKLCRPCFAFWCVRVSLGCLTSVVDPVSVDNGRAVAIQGVFDAKAVEGSLQQRVRPHFCIATLDLAYTRSFDMCRARTEIFAAKLSQDSAPFEDNPTAA